MAGSGLGHVEAGVVLEEIGRNLSPSPFLATAVAAVEALKGTAQAGKYFPGILSGDTVAALAIDEQAKFRDSVALKAERSGNGFKLIGQEAVRHARPCRRPDHRRRAHRRVGRRRRTASRCSRSTRAPPA